MNLWHKWMDLSVPSYDNSSLTRVESLWTKLMWRLSARAESKYGIHGVVFTSIAFNSAVFMWPFLAFMIAERTGGETFSIMYLAFAAQSIRCANYRAIITRMNDEHTVQGII